jgi:hypothetical protein
LQALHLGLVGKLYITHLFYFVNTFYLFFTYFFVTMFLSLFFERIKMKTVKELLKLAGSVGDDRSTHQNVANACDVSKLTVNYWSTKNCIPVRHREIILQLLHLRGNADITIHDIDNACDGGKQ